MEGKQTLQAAGDHHHLQQSRPATSWVGGGCAPGQSQVSLLIIWLVGCFFFIRWLFFGSVGLFFFGCFSLGGCAPGQSHVSLLIIWFFGCFFVISWLFFGSVGCFCFLWFVFLLVDWFFDCFFLTLECCFFCSFSLLVGRCCDCFQTLQNERSVENNFFRRKIAKSTEYSLFLV